MLDFRVGSRKKIKKKLQTEKTNKKERQEKKIHEIKVIPLCVYVFKERNKHTHVLMGTI